MEKHIFTWEDYHVMLQRAVRGLKKAFPKGLPFTHVVGMPRGGEIVSIALSHAFTYLKYVNYGQVEDKISYGSHVLLVDDLIETGATLYKQINIWHLNKGLRFQVLVLVARTLVMPTIGDHRTLLGDGKIGVCYRMPDVSKWAVFPYENLEKEQVKDGTIA